MIFKIIFYRLSVYGSTGDLLLTHCSITSSNSLELLYVAETWLSLCKACTQSLQSAVLGSCSDAAMWNIYRNPSVFEHLQPSAAVLTLDEGKKLVDKCFHHWTLNNSLRCMIIRPLEKLSQYIRRWPAQ